jgi:hypothetical protein
VLTTRWAYLVILIISASFAAAQTQEKRITPVDVSARRTFDRQPKIAILVGVGAYPEGSGLAPLKYATLDVADLGAELEKQGLAVDRASELQGQIRVYLRLKGVDLSHVR